MQSIVVERTVWGDCTVSLRHRRPVGNDPAPGERCTIASGDAVVEVEHLLCERPRERVRVPMWMGASLASAVFHAALLGALSWAVPKLDEPIEALDRETAAFLTARAGAVEDEKPRGELFNGHRRYAGLDDGDAHRGKAGKIGALLAPPRDSFFAVAGVEDRHSVVAARIEAGDYGALSALAAALEKHAPESAFNGTGEVWLGSDPYNVVGVVDGEQPGESFGSLGLAPTGPGLFGGGLGEGIGIGIKGTRWGGCGCGAGRVGYTHKVGRPPRILEHAPETTGKLPPEVVRRIIRANLPRFQACYDIHLRSDPSLAGTVITRFVVDTTGAVETATTTGGSIAHVGLRWCTLAVYQSLSFPEPESGKLLVTHVLEFQRE